MKGMISRFLVLPFYIGCLSQSTVGEFDSTRVVKKSKPESNRVATSMAMEEGSSSSMVEIKKSWNPTTLNRSNISKAMDRLIRITFKGFTQMFAYKDMEDIKIETEMEIGFPTDVKHVTHIGADGSMTTNPSKNWDPIQLPETLSFPPVSLQQFELAMAVEAEEPASPSKRS
ncbi:CRIB domain-containing protein RIC4-like [Cynara cardunculus var. scolymus]|uniref:PAK-box/P21-Rho-binding n=1 Tax=Cynara cardunculus var. scolymus TaxID=59895 RepID=A0A118JZR8_CYNCS|nr:CRIB domain-containing protein RIC4-like [Cynara cardunculus var. scolymus]KVI00317.1 PAK-box/P21-Rho-binding [Cynara cardunculus var. scolymus]